MQRVPNQQGGSQSVLVPSPRSCTRPKFLVTWVVAGARWRGWFDVDFPISTAGTPSTLEWYIFFFNTMRPNIFHMFFFCVCLGWDNSWTFLILCMVCVSPNESDKNGHVEAQLVRKCSAGATSPAAWLGGDPCDVEMDQTWLGDTEKKSWYTMVYLGFKGDIVTTMG